MIRSTVAAVALCLVSSLPAQAAQVFFDDFASDTPALQTTLTNFTVTGGIDVVGPVNVFGITTPGGNVVDLDGSIGPGRIDSISSFSFNAGDTVTLSALLSGAQRGSISDLFSFGFVFQANTLISNFLVSGHFSDSIPGPLPADGIFLSNGSLAGDAAYLTTSASFVAEQAGSLRFFFETLSGDNIGPLVTNVALDITAPSPVPLPAGGFLLLAGLGALAAARRKRA